MIHKSLVVFTTLLVIIMTNSFTNSTAFKEEQLKFPRVQESYNEKESTIKNLLAKQQLSTNNLNVFIRIFKQEDILEIWGKAKENPKYKLIKTYPICSKSGILGPKRKQGDYQVPEGFYHISAFNPNSNFYLSMMINYPNQSDRILGAKGNLGNNICIHGNCVTIGCIPITDDLIKEVYIFATEAKNNGQNNIPVHIFPFKLTSNNLLMAKTGNNAVLTNFWNNLKSGYYAFENTGTIPQFKVADDGGYVYY